jgi:AcrR family transcriptional regulator
MATGGATVAARPPEQLDAAPVLGADPAVSLSHNLNGQKLGRKGRDTRERIIAAAAALIAESDEAQVSMTAVARRVSLGMTSLYNYFADLTELVLAVLEPVMATAQDEYAGLLGQRWPDSELDERCLEFVLAYHHFWARNSRLLHLRNAMADQLDERMIDHRVTSTRPVIDQLAWQMAGVDGIIRSEARRMASMVVTGVERSVTIATDRMLADKLGWDVEADEHRFVAPGARLMALAIRDMRGG